jgi:hypothetical protein
LAQMHRISSLPAAPEKARGGRNSEVLALSVICGWLGD